PPGCRPRGPAATLPSRRGPSNGAALYRHRRFAIPAGVFRPVRGGRPMSQDATDSPTDAPRPWWDGAEVLVLIALVIAAYFFRAGDLPLRGEEPTRAQVAVEMTASGDYLVPRFQGESFRIR